MDFCKRNNLLTDSKILTDQEEILYKIYIMSCVLLSMYYSALLMYSFTRCTILRTVHVREDNALNSIK